MLLIENDGFEALHAASLYDVLHEIVQMNAHIIYSEYDKELSYPKDRLMLNCIGETISRALPAGKKPPQIVLIIEWSGQHSADECFSKALMVVDLPGQRVQDAGPR